MQKVFQLVAGGLELLPFDHEPFGLLLERLLILSAKVFALIHRMDGVIQLFKDLLNIRPREKHASTLRITRVRDGSRRAARPS